MNVEDGDKINTSLWRFGTCMGPSTSMYLRDSIAPFIIAYFFPQSYTRVAIRVCVCLCIFFSYYFFET